MSSHGQSGPVTHFFLAAGGAGGAIAHGLTYVTDQLDDQLHHLHRVDCRLWLAKRWTTLPLDYEQLAMLLGVSYVLLGLLTVVPRCRMWANVLLAMVLSFELWSFFSTVEKGTPPNERWTTAGVLMLACAANFFLSCQALMEMPHGIDVLHKPKRPLATSLPTKPQLEPKKVR